MKNKKIISLLFSVALIMSTFACLSVSTVTASESEAEIEIVIDDFTAIVYGSELEKLNTMELVFTSNGFEMWYHRDTGEVAVREISTGQILFTNPYDAGNADAAPSTDTKKKLLSQLIIKYTESDRENTFTSYNDAALNGQIKMKRVKGGIRVEYTIGRVQKRKLVPRQISEESYQTNIMSYFTDEREISKMNAYYLLKDASDPTLTERQRKQMQLSWPVTSKMAIRVFDPVAPERDKTEIEKLIKKNCPHYTYEMLDADHALVGYTAVDKSPPLFKMALEYYIDEEGLYVRLPASGISFDESTYQLSTINVLPYFGAGRRGNTGYNFVPDGSGTIIKYEDIKDTPYALSNTLYGFDYAYYNISGSHTEKWRLPVFGIVENSVFKEEEIVQEVIPATVDEEGNEIPAQTVDTVVDKSRPISSGFLAIIEEGDALSQIITEHGGNTHKYNNVYTIFTPRPTDSYSLSGSGSGTSSMWNVTSKRKYTGNYIIRYKMLFGEKANYMGMVEAYREYLEKRGAITRIEEENEDIPLYIESFGLIHTEERVFGFPVEVKTPLTTFDDAKTMIDRFNEQGITNINIKYTGWANGGMYRTAPTKLSVEKVLGGSKGLTDLVNYAQSKGATIYPDIDFAVAIQDQMFDGFSYKKDTVMTVSESVASIVEYDYITQGFNYFSGMVISPNVMEKMYNSTIKEYSKLNVGALSVASLGNYLTSDHNKNALLTRDDSKTIITNLLEKMKEDNGKLMVSVGNAYTFPYVSAILDASLDSSRYNNTSASIPFYGMVTHGYIDITGSPINMAGDYRYEVLKAIENGSNPYFTLSYQNSNKLKYTGYYQYYSIDFETWFDDVVETYKELNEALKPVRNKLIINHEFIQGNNVVKVTYEGGIAYILNYNNETITVDGVEIGPLQFIRAK